MTGAPHSRGAGDVAAQRVGDVFTASDLEQLSARGVSAEEALRQVAALAQPDHYVRLDRACTVGDGIARIASNDRMRFAALSRAAVAAGRCTKFVPASGAASRMFADLAREFAADPPADAATLAARAAQGDQAATATLAFVDAIDRFAFHDTLAAHARRLGHDMRTAARAREFRPVLEALLSARGMNAAALPKALIEFHRYGGATRTAFEEQLAESAALAADRDGTCRAHFTVAPDFRADFEAQLERARAALAPGMRLDVTFSVQHPDTDTIAVDLENRPFHVHGDRLLFRPAGHGALIENLGALGADIVWIKNIDNVVPERLWGSTLEWSDVLAGLLVEVQGRTFEWVRRLEAGASAADVAGAAAFLREAFGVTVAEAGDRDVVRHALCRPIRVCGMVPNTGEPGGGPYFVRFPDGETSPEIVESAQVNHGDPAQAHVFRDATHFNPVFIACALRDENDRPYDLDDFVDASAVIVTHKSVEGRPLKALERPGLWNGAMAGWNSIFVEVPIEVFNPVKTVLDLLRPEHQPGPAA